VVALAFLRAYQAQPAHVQYWAAAQQVFTRIEQTPDQAVCGGGVIWGDGTNYKMRLRMRCTWCSRRDWRFE